MAKRKKAAKRKKVARGLWSRDDVKLLRKVFPGRNTRDVANELGRPLQAVKKKASRLGLRKSKTYLKSIRRA